MRKFLVALFVLLLSVLSLTACSEKAPNETTDLTEDVITENNVTEYDAGEDDAVWGEQAELTVFANGGTIWVGAEEPYDITLSASTMDTGVTFAEVIEEKIHSIEKENAEFAGWTIYAVSDGEWVTDEVTDLAEGQLCVACGHYGYYLMYDYEVVAEAATTTEMLATESDGRDFYVLANWK